jgi:hypothetical protein
MKMNEYSEELKSAVMDFVKDERNEEENQNFIPNEVALPKKNFLTEYKNYKSDWVDEDYFLVEFKDIIKIVDKGERR